MRPIVTMSIEEQPKAAPAPFWKTKALDQMSEVEWESLCDGCGKCCLNKLEDWDTGEFYYTNVACTLLDLHTCRCSDYENRMSRVPDCLKLSIESVPQYAWLPPTCAYKLVAQGKDLPDWHYLVCGNREEIHRVGMSIRNRCISEDGIAPEELENHLVDWVDSEK